MLIPLNEDDPKRKENKKQNHDINDYYHCVHEALFSLRKPIRQHHNRNEIENSRYEMCSTTVKVAPPR